MAWTLLGSLTSALKKNASLHSAAAFSPASTPMSATHTRAPPPPQTMAPSRPTPPPAPVTTETLLARHGGAVRGFDERGREPEAGPGGRGTAKQGRALYERGDLVAVIGRDQRAHLRVRVFGVPNAKSRGRIDQQLEEPVIHRPLDEDSRARAAVLAGIAEHRRGRRRGRLLQVRVREDHVGRLAAQLERDPLDRAGRAFHDPDAHLGRTGEAHLDHVRMCY